MVYMPGAGPDEATRRFAGARIDGVTVGVAVGVAVGVGVEVMVGVLVGVGVQVAVGTGDGRIWAGPTPGRKGAGGTIPRGVGVSVGSPSPWPGGTTSTVAAGNGAPGIVVAGKGAPGMVVAGSGAPGIVSRLPTSGA
jgi:hypothetical protein